MSRPSHEQISQFLSQRFSGFRFVQSRDGFSADMKLADEYDIRAAIACEFGVDVVISFLGFGSLHVEVIS